MEKEIVAVCQCDVDDSGFFGEVAETSTKISTDAVGVVRCEVW